MSPFADILRDLQNRLDTYNSAVERYIDAAQPDTPVAQGELPSTPKVVVPSPKPEDLQEFADAQLQAQLAVVNALHDIQDELVRQREENEAASVTVAEREKTADKRARLGTIYGTIGALTAVAGVVIAVFAH